MHSTLSDFFDKNASLYTEVKTNYEMPGRHYHNWSHIQELLRAFETCVERLHDPEAVLLAIYYHDVIYQALSSTNEEDSAALFVEHATGKLNDTCIAFIENLILATKDHVPVDGMMASNYEDCLHFLDMDISILGAPEPDYQKYVEGVRQEYSMVPEALFNNGRLTVLKGFQSRPRLFLTDLFHNTLDTQARINIANEIDVLQGHV